MNISFLILLCRILLWLNLYKIVFFFKIKKMSIHMKTSFPSLPYTHFSLSVLSLFLSFDCSISIALSLTLFSVSFSSVSITQKHTCIDLTENEGETNMICSIPEEWGTFKLGKKELSLLFFSQNKPEKRIFFFSSEQQMIALHR